MCKLYTETTIEPGGFSEFFKVTKTNVDRGGVIKLPDTVSFEEATFIEPLACCIRSINKFKVKPESTVAIIGCGPMGLLNLKYLKTLSVSKIMCIDLLDYRLSLAKKMGATLSINPSKDNVTELINSVTDKRGADIVIVASGSKEAYSQAFNLIRRGGAINIFGAPSKNSEIVIKIGKMFYDEISLIPSYSTTELDIDKALMLIAAKKIYALDLVTHRYDLSRAIEAFNTVINSTNSLKVLLTSTASL